VWGLGALLYGTITGRPPFVASDPAALGYLPMVSLPEPPSSFRTDLPVPMQQLVQTLLARDPTRRPNDLAKIAETLSRAATGKPGTPVLGMRAEREEIRRAIVGAADGECRVVVVYGVPGSGRRTLINEAADLARREGMPYLKETDPAEIEAALRKSKKPAVIAVRGAAPGVLDMCRRLLDDHVPGLVLVHGDRPVPGLENAIVVTPPPLALDEAVTLVVSMGAPEEQVEAWWRASYGHPIAIAGRVRAWHREHGEIGPPPDLELPSGARKILQALRRTPEMPIPDLARHVSMGEHELLDHAEVLFAEGLVEASADGSAIRITAAGKPAGDTTEEKE
jgi:hypothetical protein